ncbi:MAG: dTMP kinase [Coprothermobacterota bacterium]|jgi:dTMP kinase|nr:dTMP kinase [Coprothermobacterota bacterium]
MRGFFITLEGIDGCGKSTQAQLLAAQLRELGFPVLVTGEPGATRIGSQISRILLDPANPELSPMAEMLLYLADRAQHLIEKILPALEGGQVVICTRFHDSTLAYQCWGRGLPCEEVRRTCLFTSGGLQPDLTVVLDMEPNAALERTSGDRLEAEGLGLQEKVREAYLALAIHDPERIRIVSGEGQTEQVLRRIWRWVLHLLEQNPHGCAPPLDQSE